jgi:hypothetical protein
MGWRGCVDQASITLDRPGHSLRRWLPLQRLARVLRLMSCLGDLDIINTPSMINGNWLFSNMFDSGWRSLTLFYLSSS